MTTLQWITDFAESMVSAWLVLPALIAVVWLVFAVRIGRRHHLTEEDLLEKGKWLR